MRYRQSVIAVLAVLVTVSLAWALAPWSISGSAMAVNSGPPQGWTFKLVSNSTQPYSSINFQQPNGKLTFGEIYLLSAAYNVTNTDCGGGSPRFSIAIDRNGDGSFTQPEDGNVFVYFGPTPNFTGCATNWQSTGNLITNADLRFDTSQVGGTFYDSYAGALSLVGDKPVLGVSLDVDGGWLAPQTILVDNVTVNNFVLSAKGYKK